MKIRSVAKYEYFGSNMSWINKVSQSYDFFVHFRFDINPLSHEFFSKIRQNLKENLQLWNAALAVKIVVEGQILDML